MNGWILIEQRQKDDDALCNRRTEAMVESFPSESEPTVDRLGVGKAGNIWWNGDDRVDPAGPA